MKKKELADSVNKAIGDKITKDAEDRDAVNLWTLRTAERLQNERDWNGHKTLEMSIAAAKGLVAAAEQIAGARLSAQAQRQLVELCGDDYIDQQIKSAERRGKIKTVGAG